MKSVTLSVAIAAAPKEVFGFVANPENMPRWAVNFCRGVRRKGDRWLVTTPNGDVEMVIESSAEHGVVDFHWQPAPDVKVLAPTRVVPNEAGAEYIFTLIQAPDMTDEAFQAGKSGLHEELKVLKRLLEEPS